MEYTELDHLKDKEKIVTDIYEKLIIGLKEFGQIKIEPKRQAFILVTGLDLQVFILEKII